MNEMNESLSSNILTGNLLPKSSKSEDSADDYHRWYHLGHIFHICSLSVLSLMMVEIAAKMIFIPKHFFTHKVEIFDALVVIVAWSLDVVLLVDPYLVHSAVSLMVFVRFWRIIRVLNGTMVTVKSDANARVHKHKKRLAELIQIGVQNDELYNRMVEVRENNIWLNKQNMAIQAKQDALKTKIKNLHLQNDNLNEECKQMTSKIHNSDVWDDKSPSKSEKADDNQSKF